MAEWVYNAGYNAYVADAGPYIGPLDTLAPPGYPLPADADGVTLYAMLDQGVPPELVNFFAPGDPYGYSETFRSTTAASGYAQTSYGPIPAGARLYVMWYPTEYGEPPAFPSTIPNSHYTAEQAEGGTGGDTGPIIFPESTNTTLGTAIRHVFVPRLPADAIFIDDNYRLPGGGVLWWGIRLQNGTNPPSRPGGGMLVEMPADVTWQVWESDKGVLTREEEAALVASRGPDRAFTGTATMPTNMLMRTYLIRVTVPDVQGTIRWHAPPPIEGDVLLQVVSDWHRVDAYQYDIPGGESGYFHAKPGLEGVDGSAPNGLIYSRMGRIRDERSTGTTDDVTAPTHTTSGLVQYGYHEVGGDLWIKRWTEPQFSVHFDLELLTAWWNSGAPGTRREDFLFRPTEGTGYDIRPLPWAEPFPAGVHRDQAVGDWDFEFSPEDPTMSPYTLLEENVSVDAAPDNEVQWGYLRTRGLADSHVLHGDASLPELPELNAKSYEAQHPTNLVTTGTDAYAARTVETWAYADLDGMDWWLAPTVHAGGGLSAPVGSNDKGYNAKLAVKTFPIIRIPDYRYKLTIVVGALVKQAPPMRQRARQDGLAAGTGARRGGSEPEMRQRSVRRGPGVVW